MTLLSLIPRRFWALQLRQERAVSTTLRQSVHSLSARLSTAQLDAAALRHDLHCATAHAAQQARTITHQADTIDLLHLTVLGLQQQLTATMIRAGEALSAAEMDHALPYDAGDYTARDYARDGRTG